MEWKKLDVWLVTSILAFIKWHFRFLKRDFTPLKWHLTNVDLPLLKKMLKEKAGETAGKIWNALNETEGLTAKQIKKATKLVDKDLYLGLGWLLREDKISTSEVEGELFVKLN